jgi:hypothetical protein
MDESETNKSKNPKLGIKTLSNKVMEIEQSLEHYNEPPILLSDQLRREEEKKKQEEILEKYKSYMEISEGLNGKSSIFKLIVSSMQFVETFGDLLSEFLHTIPKDSQKKNIVFWFLKQTYDSVNFDEELSDFIDILILVQKGKYLLDSKSYRKISYSTQKYEDSPAIEKKSSVKKPFLKKVKQKLK